MGEVADFAEPLNDLAERLTAEQKERKADDQELINLLNEVCLKMYHKFQKEERSDWLLHYTLNKLLWGTWPCYVTAALKAKTIWLSIPLDCSQPDNEGTKKYERWNRARLVLTLFFYFDYSINKIIIHHLHSIFFNYFHSGRTCQQSLLRSLLISLLCKHVVILTVTHFQLVTKVFMLVQLWCHFLLVVPIVFNFDFLCCRRFLYFFLLMLRIVTLGLFFVVVMVQTFHQLVDL